MKGGRVAMAVVVAIIAIVGYFMSTEVVENPFTGEDQRVALSPEEEIALGLQTAPKVSQQFGGDSANAQAQSAVDRVGRRIVDESRAADTPYEFEFTVLQDQETVNAFALPGGPIFITQAMLDRLNGEAELAGIMAHEVGHVVGRHGSEQIAKQQMLQQLGLAGAILVSDGGDSNRREQQLALLAAQIIGLRYTREHENESDRLAVDLMAEAGYDPRELIDVMETLREAGGPQPPEFFSSHPDPGNRIEHIQQLIDAKYPDGVPADLEGGPNES